VSFLDAAGLNVLVGAASLAARRGSRIAVRGADPAVFEELAAAGLVVMLDVRPAAELPGKELRTFFSLATWITAIVGAVAVLLAVRLVTDASGRLVPGRRHLTSRH